MTSRFGDSGGDLGGQWKTVFDLDLAALPTSWSNADGVYAMGGFNWTKYGTATQRGGGASNLFGIENGVGFRTQVAGAGWPISQNISNRPYLTLQLSSVIPNFTRHTPVRFSWISAVGGDAINDVSHFAGFAIQNDAAIFRVNWTQQYVMNSDPAVALSFSSYSYSGPLGTSSCVNAETSAEYLTRRIARTTMPQGFGGMFAVHELASGIVWPLETDWIWSGTAFAYSASGGPAAIPLSGQREKLFAEFGASNNGHTLPGPWFTRLKLEGIF